MSSTSSPGNNDRGPYFVHIGRLPVRYTWRDLKDLIRPEAWHGVWTEMEIYPNGQSSGVGFARVKRHEQAINLYNYLKHHPVDGNWVNVHVWDVSNSPPRMIKCNCRSEHAMTAVQVLEVASYSGNAGGWTVIQPEMSSAQPLAQYGYTATPRVSYVPVVTQPAQATMVPQVPTYHRPRQDPRYLAQVHHPVHDSYTYTAVRGGMSQSRPSYASSATGTPINVGAGFARTESRGVFVRGLSYGATFNDVYSTFKTCGSIVKCDVPKSGTTGKIKGIATIEFGSAEAALKAVEKLHGRTHMGKKIEVRIDRETTTVVPPTPTSSRSTPRKTVAQPVVVNGSVDATRAYSVRT